MSEATDEHRMNLAVPDHLLYTEDHVWVSMGEELAVIGMTEHATVRLGELSGVTLPQEGDEVRAGDEIVELETGNGVEPLISPVSGVVRYINHALEDDPSVIVQDPYGEGWMLKIAIDDDEPDLLDADGYAAAIQ